jgi:hypothetical protein
MSVEIRSACQVHGPEGSTDLTVLEVIPAHPCRGHRRRRHVDLPSATFRLLFVMIILARPPQDCPLRCHRTSDRGVAVASGDRSISLGYRSSLSAPRPRLVLRPSVQPTRRNHVGYPPRTKQVFHDTNTPAGSTLWLSRRKEHMSKLAQRRPSSLSERI